MKMLKFRREPQALLIVATLAIFTMITASCGEPGLSNGNGLGNVDGTEPSSPEPEPGLTGGDPGDEENTLSTDRHVSCDSENVVREAPADATEYIREGLTRYAELVAPNGQVIKIFGAPEAGDERIRRARSLLLFFLQDVSGSQFGANKSEVANRMALNRAVLVMPPGEHVEGSEPQVDAQPLYAHETPVEGSAWYMQNNYDHRDAAFEEIFHLVHDTGIGTYLPGALPEYQARLVEEAEASLLDGRWGISVDPFVSEWIEELRQEDSLAQEYIASVLDSYYGLWAPWDEAEGGMWGVYIAKTRAEVADKDPQGYALLEAFLPKWLNYEVHLAAELEGDFHMTLDPSKPYTHKSQYLVDVTLTGSNASNLFANGQDNTLKGNSADNIIDGKAGKDTVVYCQARSAYNVSQADGKMIVEGPNGRDVLKDIEVIHFADGAVLADDL